jgi:2-amino-4-hydroxy-6-hydroxymethyldihydropteridine diphosphokinase
MASSAVATTRAYIGLGSNLEDPPGQIKKALRALAMIPATSVIADSGLYLSKPMVLDSNDQQPDYYNAVVLVETQLSAHALLDHLQQIEREQGRVRGERWGARTIDLDILLFDDQVINDERLTVPHPGLHEREFVLYPLQNIDSTLTIPGRGKLEELVENCPDNGLKYLGVLEN